MLQKLLSSLAITVFSLANIYVLKAQSPEGWRPCGTAEMQQQYLAQHPDAAREYQEMLRTAASLNAQQRQLLLYDTTTVVDVTVPVVIHIMYYGIPANNTNAPTNISDRQINDAIDVVNTDYRRHNADTSDIIPIFKQRIASVGFRFRLAKIDPNGNCTTGITRHYSIETNYGTSRVTGIVDWPRDKYLNIWIIDNVSFGAGGYTFNLSGDCSTLNDGIVLRNTQFGSIGRSCGANLCTRSLTHEIGHYFGLYHTWGPTNTPGIASNCGFTDYVSDTPQTAGYSQSTNGPCDTNYALCNDASGNPIIANVQNYMDYADCEKMFTLGQKAVMRALIVSSSCRRNLVSAANLVATGTNDGYGAVPCAPIVAFNPTKTTVCEGGSVQFRDYSYNINASGGTVHYAWSFPGGTPATATVLAPTVSYANAGVYDVTLTVTNSAGMGTTTTRQLIQVTGATSGLIAPLVNSFERSTYPNYSTTNPQRNYTTYYTSPTTYSTNTGWVRRQASGVTFAADSNAFLIVNNLQYAASTLSTLITPNINLSSLASPNLSFSYFYGMRDGITSNAALNVSFSTDCGTTWNSIQSYSASVLNLTGTTYQPGALPASPADWQTIQIPITNPYRGSTHFQIRFQMSNGAVPDNNFYFDKLQVSDLLGTHNTALTQHSISVYPNPLTNETAVHLELASSSTVQISLTDVLGREVLTVPAKAYPAGMQVITLPTSEHPLQAGVYLVRVGVNGESYTSKLAVQ